MSLGIPIISGRPVRVKNARLESIAALPVVLCTEEESSAWLNPEIVERGPLEGLMRPLGDGVLEVVPAVAVQ
jgi:hypothetical protein